MKTILKLTFLLFIGSTYGQDLNTNQYRYLFYIQTSVPNSWLSPFGYEYRMTDLVKGKNVKSVKKSWTYKGKNYWVNYNFNKKGKIKSFDNYKGDNGEVNYLNDTMIVSFQMQSKKDQYKTNYDYLNGNVYKKEALKNGELTQRTTTFYNDSGEVVYSSVQNLKKKKVYAMNYHYDDSGVKLKEQEYYINKKLIQKWDYTCLPEGQTVEKEKQTNICYYQEENNDGSFISFKRNLTNDGATLTKNYYNPDSVWYKQEVFNNLGVQVSLTEKDSISRIHKTFDKKGRVIQESITTVEGQKTITQKFKDRRHLSIYSV